MFLIYLKAVIVLLTFLSSDNSHTKPRDWKLVWSDEFNYSGVPDSTKWNYEEWTRRNHEKQAYTKSLSNVNVANGTLNIIGRKEKVANVRYSYRKNSKDWWAQDSVFNYTSGSITTKGKFHFMYGKIEVRARVPKGSGTWPAVWMLGIDESKRGWPFQGEIDIMEFFGRIARQTTASLHFMNTQDLSHISINKQLLIAEEISNEYHTYVFVWDRNMIEIFFDNVSVLQFIPEGTSVYNQQPFYLILNLALGGTGGGAIDDLIFPAKFQIDYVRYYQ